jgi:hypothetical protein
MISTLLFKAQFTKTLTKIIMKLSLGKEQIFPPFDSNMEILLKGNKFLKRKWNFSIIGTEPMR